jgi:hypothetical protein
MNRRAALLLEAMLSLVLLVTCGAAVLSIMSDAGGAVRSMREQQFAFDLARSAIAKIEAGIDTPQTLDGPVPGWDDGFQGESDQARDDTWRGVRWTLAIDVQPSQFAGLTLLTVTAEGRDAIEADRVVASASLSQLVRLASESNSEDGVGPRDPIMERLLERGERR